MSPRKLDEIGKNIEDVGRNRDPKLIPELERLAAEVKTANRLKTERQDASTRAQSARDRAEGNPAGRAAHSVDSAGKPQSVAACRCYPSRALMGAMPALTGPGMDSFSNDPPLELGEYAKHLKHRFSRSRRGVESLLVKEDDAFVHHEMVSDREAVSPV